MSTFTGNSTSSIASHITNTGLLFGIGNGASPETFAVIANAKDWASPIKSDIVDVTNNGDQWHRRVPTLNDMGESKFEVFWVMTEPTHENVSGGLRYLQINRVKKDFGVLYPDGNNSQDTIPGYISAAEVTSKIGNVFMMAVTLVNDGPPTLV